MRRSQWLLTLFAITSSSLLIALSAGCSGKLPEAAPVSGAVLHEGKPLEGATVTLRSQTEGEMVSGGLALGTTDAEGKFTLQSHVGPTEVVDGVVPGNYRVAISKFIPPRGMSEAEYEEKRAEEAKIMEAKGLVPPKQQVPPKVELLPAEYSNIQKTTLEATIPEGGTEDLKFELE